MGIEDYAAWQGRQQWKQQPEDAPLPRTADDAIDVREHNAPGTTLVRQIRAALAKRFQEP